jgi:hypothetical protein
VIDRRHGAIVSFQRLGQLLGEQEAAGHVAADIVVLERSKILPSRRSNTIEPSSPTSNR